MAHKYLLCVLVVMVMLGALVTVIWFFRTDKERGKVFHFVAYYVESDPVFTKLSKLGSNSNKHFLLFYCSFRNLNIHVFTKFDLHF